MVTSMNEQRQGRQICGYSFWGQPIFYEKVGMGDTCLLFAGDFSSNAQCEGVLERFLRDLSNCGKKDLAPVGRVGMGRLLLVRSLVFLPCPNPDAGLVKTGGLPPDSPFYPRIKRLLAGHPAILWSANGRGVDVGRNFNYRFAAYKEQAVTEPAPFGYGGCFPESEPESAAFASFSRRLSPRLFVHLTHGVGALSYEQKDRGLEGLCARYAPFERRETDLSATPEGWLHQELGCAYLRISCGFEEEETTYRLLRPLLFALTAY